MDRNILLGGQALAKAYAKSRHSGWPYFWKEAPDDFDDKLEMMIGARRDPQFGPVVVVGAGGKYVEAMKDCALLLAPFGKDDVMRALKTLRVAPLLDGVRGEPAADVDALADMAVRVGQLMVALGDTVSSIDLNPVMMTPSGPIVVDALLERA